AAQMMRRILVNYARDRQALKRGGSGQKLFLDEALARSAARDVDLVALDEALARLAALDPQQSRSVGLRFFGRRRIAAVAAALGSPPATAKRDWAMARAWLRREVRRGDQDDA